MTWYKDENGETVEANDYQEAAEKLYGQGRSHNDRCYTTMSRRRRGLKGEGWADVKVWKPGSKIGSFYGVQADVPIKHTLHRVK